MFSIGNINIKNRVILAPMAGVTDHPFRLICKNQGAGLVYTEFVSAEQNAGSTNYKINIGDPSLDFENDQVLIGIFDQ